MESKILKTTSTVQKEKRDRGLPIMKLRSKLTIQIIDQKLLFTTLILANLVTVKIMIMTPAMTVK